MNSARERTRTPAWAAACVILLCVALVFGRVLTHGSLIWDDDIHVFNNPYLRPPTLAGLGRFWARPYAGLYAPLSYTLFWLCALPARWSAEFAPDPLVFHCASLVLHATNALFVFRLAARLVDDRRPALVGALFFALHPLQVESVAWISELRGLLCAGLGLFALELYLFRVEGRAGLRSAISALALFTLALLAKPVAVVFLPIAAVLDVLWLGRPLAHSCARLAPGALLALGALLLTKGEQLSSGLRFVPTLAERPAVALDALGFYLEKLVWPFGLAPDHGRTPARVLAAGFPLAALLACAALCICVLLVPARRRAWALVLVFVGVLAPVLGFVPFAFQDVSTVAERYAYLALIAPALGLAWLCAQSRRALVPALVLVLALGAASFVAVAPWRDTRTLFEHTLALNPESVVACNDLALEASLRGEKERAREFYARALVLDPKDAIAHNNLGLLALQDGHSAEALERFHAAIAIKPDYTRARSNLAVALLAAGQPVEAEREARTAAADSIEDPNAHVVLGNMLVGQKKLAEAQESYDRALAIHPTDALTLHALGLVHANLGKLGLARAELVRALELVRARDPKLAAQIEGELVKLDAARPPH